jgi:hypothetical protein
MQKIANIVQVSLELENQFYLLGYDKDIKNIVQKLATKTVPI